MLRATGVGFVLGLLPGCTPGAISFISYDVEKRAVEDAGAVRARRHRGRGGAGGRQQCHHQRRLRAALRAGPAGHARAGRAAERSHDLRPAAGPAAVREAAAVRVDGHRQHVRRQRDAADPQPAAGRPVGAALPCSLRGDGAADPDLQRAGRVQRAQQLRRRRHGAGLRGPRLPDGQARLSHRAAGAGADPHARCWRARCGSRSAWRTAAPRSSWGAPWRLS